jgi:hypothetical protein
LVGQLLNWILKTGTESSEALTGDPPRADYQTETVPERYPFRPAESGQFVPEAMIRAVGDAEKALLEMVAMLRAATIAKDRFAGAAQAGDKTWMRRQSEMSVEYARQAGAAMESCSGALRRLLQAAEDAGYQDIPLSEEAVRAGRERVRANGLPASEVALARAFGYNDEQIEAERQQFLAMDPATVRRGYPIVLGFDCRPVHVCWRLPWPAKMRCKTCSFLLGQDWPAVPSVSSSESGTGSYRDL